MQQPVTLIPVQPPPSDQRSRRNAKVVAEGERANRYSLPRSLHSHSPIGYRHRVSVSEAEAKSMEPLLSLSRPSAFVAGEPVTEQELFEESSLGILSSRQSTNFRGFRQHTVGPQQSERIATILQQLSTPVQVRTQATHTHLIVSQPYRTPFTLLLTFVGHKQLSSLWTVPKRAWNKKVHFVDDIPTIGYLEHLHLGILADGMERAAVVASCGRRRANVIVRPFCDNTHRTTNAAQIEQLEALIGLTPQQRSKGWRLRMVVQVGAVEDPLNIARETYRKLGANLLSFRSERIQPGVNQEDKAPPQYQRRQEADVSQEFVYMAGRAVYNAFVHWTGVDRTRAKELLLMERVDVLTEHGKSRLRAIRKELGDITDNVVRDIPKWADIPMGRALSRNAARGRKAFALAGQRIYIGGLDKQAVQKENLPWNLAVQAVGAAASRSALYCELSGCIDLPQDCDLLTGMCLMAGPVNQNDIGKQFYEYRDLLADAFPDQDPTSLLLWTLKVKTVSDPIGNEEQLLNAKRKGALVDLRGGPHELITVERDGTFSPLRAAGSQERAFADVNNFVTSNEGEEIEGNRGVPWPDEKSKEILWP